MAKQKTSKKPKSQVDVYYEKGWNLFLDSLVKPDDVREAEISKAHGLLTMAYEESGSDLKAKRGIAGMISFVLTQLKDFKNAEEWARKELELDQNNVPAKLTLFYTSFNKWVEHKGPGGSFNDGSWLGIFVTIASVGANASQSNAKKEASRKAALEAAKIVQEYASKPDADHNMIVFGAAVLTDIIANLWANDIRETDLCQTVLNLPWNRIKAKKNKKQKEGIDEIIAMAYSYLGRTK